MCQDYFKVHGMMHTGKVQDLRGIITNLNNNNNKEGPPKISELTFCFSDDIYYCVGSIISMVPMVIIRKVSPVFTSQKRTEK